MMADWAQQRERGGRTGLQVMIWLSLRLGRRLARLISRPITVYFFLSSFRGRAASRTYLARVFGRAPHWYEGFRHVLTFAEMLLDRPFLLTRRLEHYDIRIVGMEHLTPWVERGQGCLLLGSHLGSFEVLRTAGEADPRIRLRALMHEGAAASTTLFRALNPEIARNVIPLGTVSTMLQVKEALAAGEMIGMLGDRGVRGDKVERIDFLGHPAPFPLGPFVLAGLLQAPIVLCFGFCCGDGRYEIRFEPFADAVVLNRATRHAELRALATRYAGRLEHYCRQYPYNWFNFYDFWEQPSP